MQFRIWAAISIFTGSYLPLSLILLVQDFKFSFLNRKICTNFWKKGSNCELPLAHPYLSISIFVFCLVCFLLTLFILSCTKTKRSINLIETRYVPTELMSYTLPYVVSFMGVGYHEEGKFIGILIFLGWMFWITHKSGQIILNPVLVVFGWRLYDITYSNLGEDKQHTARALSKTEMQIGKQVKFATVQDVMITRE